MTQLDPYEIVRLYDEEDMSTHAIAKLFNTYPNKINRLLKKHGYQTRDKSEAQTNAIKTGTSIHPTKGKERPEHIKIQISEKTSNYWKNMSKEEKERRSKISKDLWNKLSDEDKDNMRKAAGESMRDAAKNGSKLERFLVDQLRNNGYNVIFHGKSIVGGTEFEVDLFIPELQTVLEVDGPSHFLPIWGEEILQKRIKADNEKNALLLSKQLFVIRLKCCFSELSLKRRNIISSIIIDKLNQIHNGKCTEKFIELEID